MSESPTAVATIPRVARTVSREKSETWVAVLGRRDFPVDGVEDYCGRLGEALAVQGVELVQLRILWAENGWFQSLRRLWREEETPSEKWAILQFTAQSWSRRGFPFGALAVLWVFRRRNVRCAVMFHEPVGLVRRQRFIDRIRGACQDWTIRALHDLADKSIFADPFDKIPWLATKDPKAAFISIGANIPERLSPSSPSANARRGAFQISIFCLTEAPHLDRELKDILTACSVAGGASVPLRLLFIGRGTQEAAAEIEKIFGSTAIEYEIAGIRSPDEISNALAASDVMVCVRGKLYPRRGSAIAGIACGLPLIAYGGEAEGTPLAEAGVLLVPYGDAVALGKALARVLSDPQLRWELCEKSIAAQKKYYSWECIAPALVKFLSPELGATASATDW
jgi:glycosyltransferase involved in cell wall biosynthesis